MQFISKLFIISITLLSQYSFSEESKLKVLKTKQSLNNIRFISSDGKFTYYQRRSGDLLLSKNYLNLPVLKNEKHTEYFIHSSLQKKNLIVEVDDSFHTQMSYLKLNKLYMLEYGKEDAKELGTGISPRLHLKDTFYSTYNPKVRTINYYKSTDSKKVFSITLANPLNPFFIPETTMITNYDFIYTDLNKEGQNAILLHSVLDKKTQRIYKSTLPGGKVEYCVLDNKLYVGEFSFGDVQNSSKIIEIPLYNNKNFKNMKVIYQSQQSDIGNMNCIDNKIYFIKTLSYNKDINLKTSEIATYDIKNNTTTILSDLNYVTQMIRIDDMLVSPFRGKYYLIKGDASLTQDSIKKDEAVDKRDLNFK